MMVQFFTEVQAKLQGVSPSEAMGPLRSLRLTVIFLRDSTRTPPSTSGATFKRGADHSFLRFPLAGVQDGGPTGGCAVSALRRRKT